MRVVEVLQGRPDTLLLELGVTDAPAAAPAASATALAAAAPKAGLPALAAQSPAHPAETTAAQREIELARTLVVHEVRSIERAQRCKPRAAACLLLERARTGALRPALLAKLRQACDARGRKADGADDGLPSLVSLQRWMRAQAGGASLAPRASAQIDLSVRPWHRAFFALADRPQKPDIKSAHAQLAAAWQPAWGAQPPSYDAVLRAYAKYSALDKLKGRHSGSALRARTFYHRRTYDGLEPFAEVHADGWTSHFTAPHPVTGEYVTLEIWHFHDVATRFVTPMAVGQTESGDVILQGLEACIRVGGVPAIWQTDHTSSVKNRAVMDEHAGLADRLGMSVVHPQTVGNSQANGIAENFNTWLDREARELATYQHPGRMDSATFVRVRRITNAMVKAAGRPADRDALRQKAVRMGKGIVFDSYPEAVAWVDGLQHRWNNKPHRALPKLPGSSVHMTPQQSLDAAIAAGWQPVALPEAVLADQFRPHARKTIRRGTVSTRGGARYHAAELAHHEGEEVLVAEDRDDPGQVWVKDLQGRLIAVAPLVADVAPRTESMTEHAARKRAEAQIRLRERQIEDIEARIAPPALEMLPPVPLFEPAGAAPRRQREPELLDPIDTFAHFERVKRERLAREAEAARAAGDQAAHDDDQDESDDPEMKVAAG